MSHVAVRPTTPRAITRWSVARRWSPAGRWLAVGLLAVAATSCTRHMVGPARTTDDFERKAYTTAHAALSAVETVALVARTAADGNAFRPYAIVSVSDQEDALAEVRSDFESIQPPHPDNDALRANVTAVLDRAIGDIAAVRVAIRRGQFDAVAEVAAPLDADAAALRALMEQL